MSKCTQCRKENKELNTKWERVKNWVFNHLFPQDIIDLSQDKYTQGFSDGYMAGKKAEKESYERMVKELQTIPLEQEVRKEMATLLGVFDEKLVITYDKKTGIIFIGGERLDEGRIMSLKSEAEYITNTDLWKIINNSLNQVTKQAMFEKSDFTNGTRDLDNGKSILYTLSFQQNVLNIFKSYQHKDSKTTNNMV